MRHARTATLVLAGAFLSCGATLHAQEFTAQMLESRNAAAGFAGTLKFAIGRAARRCRTLLGKDEAWMRGVVDSWLERNGRFSEAAEMWSSLLATSVAKARGDAAGQEVARQIVDIISADAERLVISYLGETEDQQKQACTTYAQSIADGRFDIPPTAEMYPELLELVAMFEEDPAEVVKAPAAPAN